MLRITDVVKHLLIINILMFVLSYFIFPSLQQTLALHYPSSERFEPFQIATHFFMHANFAHIFFNMFALFMFGSALEALWGPKRFLFFYFACAFGAAALHMFVSYLEISSMQAAIEAFQNTPNYQNYWAFFDKIPVDGLNQMNPGYKQNVIELGNAVDNGAGQNAVQQSVQLMQRSLEVTKIDVPVVGASGAIYGLLLGFGMYFPNTELMLIFLPIPIKAKYFIPFLMLVELFLGVNQFSWDNIAHYAHLGGALTGLLLILYWRKFGSRW